MNRALVLQVRRRFELKGRVLDVEVIGQAVTEPAEHLRPVTVRLAG